MPFDGAQLAEQARLSMGDPLELVLSWGRFAGAIADAAAKALRAG